MSTDTLTRGAAQAAPAPIAQSAPAAQPVAGNAFMAALGAALAQEHPALAASVEAHLCEALSQARLRRDHAQASEVSRTLEWLRDLTGAALLHDAQEPQSGGSDPDQPPATAALELWRLQAQALLHVLGYDAGRDFLQRLFQLALEEQHTSNVIPITGARRWRDVGRARRQAAAFLAACSSALVPCLGRPGSPSLIVASKRRKKEED